MYNKLFEYEVQGNPMQPSCNLNSLIIFIISAHHSSPHHEHPAQ